MTETFHLIAADEDTSGVTRGGSEGLLAPGAELRLQGEGAPNSEGPTSASRDMFIQSWESVRHASDSIRA